MATCLWLVCILCSVIGDVYALLACSLAAGLAGRKKPDLDAPEPVTLLKPLCGAESNLESNLESFCQQNYPFAVEIVCGVQDPADPATTAVQNLRAKFPEMPIALSQAPRPAVGNPKIANLISMLKLSHHDILVLSDSDMEVGAAYVRDVVAALQQPGVGLVTCLYKGQPVAGFWSKIAAAAVDQHFLPSVLVGTWLGLAKPCFGSTIALRRATLERIGGFEAFAGTLADDYAMGAAVRELGLRVAIPPFTISHTFSDSSLAEVVSHELRWARTIRLVDPFGYAGSVVTHPLPFSLAALPLSGFSAIGWMILAVTLACRLCVAIQIQRLPGGSTNALWLSPLRDLLSFAIFVLSYLPGAVSWRGHRYRVASDGTVTSI